MSASSSTERRTWLITGCSSGLGRALAEKALERGEKVAATARNVATIDDLAARYPDTCLALPLNVTDSAQCDRIVEEVQRRLGSIDVLVNNAGYIKLGALEEASDEDFRAQFDAMFFGPVNLARLVLPAMRERRQGNIIHISSIGAFTPMPGAGAYSAAKAALDIAAETLSKEVSPFGIRVTSVILGSLRTQVMAAIAYADRKLPDYASTAQATHQSFSALSGHQTGDPARAADAIIDAVTSGDAPLWLPLGPGSIDRVRTKLDSLGAALDAGAAQNLDNI